MNEISDKEAEYCKRVLENWACTQLDEVASFLEQGGGRRAGFHPEVIKAVYESDYFNNVEKEVLSVIREGKVPVLEDKHGISTSVAA